MSSSRVGRSIVVGLLVASTLIAAGCAAGDGTTASAPPPTPPVAARSVSPAVALTRGDLVRALGERGLALADAQVSFRPAEGPTLTETPRAVYQAVLPQEPNHGFIVVYDLPDPDRANQAALEQAEYLATGPGRVQSSLDAIDVIRVVGSTVVLYSWIPDDAGDPKAPDVQAALETLGFGVDVPS
jgi:hypothetical protein